MTKEKAFGIGCFHFGVKKTPPFEFKGDEYLKELTSTLSDISNLTKLNIDSDDEFKNSTINVLEELPNLSDAEGLFPHPFTLDIDFELYIPFRIQAKIIETKEKFLNTYSERFKVKCCQSFHLPVAVIEIINPTQKPTPSNGIEIVRKFLMQEFDNINSQYIRFEWLGPSPFYIDCYLKPEKPKTTQDWMFNTKEKIIKGYDELTIYYNQNMAKDSEEAFDYLFNSITDEFGFYYQCIMLRNSKMQNWMEIDDNFSDLLAIQNTSGLKGYFNRLFKRPSLIGQLFIDIAAFEGDNIFSEEFYQNSYNLVFSVKEEIFFKTFIDNALEEKNEYPVKQISDLLSFIEGRRVKSLEFIIVLIAAILGGVFGALLTYYFQA